jgi:energy-coupling factor transport system substrate-specific component
MTRPLAVRHLALPLHPRTAAAIALASAAGALAFCWPLLVRTSSPLDGAGTPLVLAGVLVAVLAVLAAALGEGGIDVKAVAILGLLTAVGSVLRPLSAGTAGVELIFVVIVLGGRVFGPGFGFALGSTTVFVSALLTGGVGPWMPFQMLAASWVGLGAGLLPRRLRGRGEVAALAAYGALAALVFGLAMNLSFWPFQIGTTSELSFVAGAPVAVNLQRFLVYSAATSLGWDVGRALTTAVGVAVLGSPVLATLRRTAARAHFAPPVGPPEEALNTTVAPNGAADTPWIPGSGQPHSPAAGRSPADSF